ncbi:MAG: translation initiation factor IF-2 [Nitrospirae bacterium]|nr:translation initiation factor IF-2 [Nitrospirota bacterium]
MPKIFELARELNVESKVIIQHLSTMGILAKTHVMRVDDEIAQRIRAKFQQPKERKFSVIRQRPGEALLPPVPDGPKAAAPPTSAGPAPEPPPTLLAAPPADGEPVPPAPVQAAAAPTPPPHAAPAATRPLAGPAAPAKLSSQPAGLRPTVVIGEAPARLLTPDKLKRPEKPLRKLDRPRELQRVIEEQLASTRGAPAAPEGRRTATPPPSRSFKKTEITTPRASKRRVKIHGAVPAAELARRMGVKANEVLKKLLALGVRITSLNQAIDADAAGLVAQEFGYEIENTGGGEAAVAEPEVPTVGIPEPRAPVVTIMGHVDHGKTTLLDTVRKANVAEQEAGGITQHIGAYQVQVKDRAIVFLDTPGHEAFTAIRARGAKATDLVVLVVGADDGVMPQTVEAVDHAKAAGVPIVVAMNKMDKPTANPHKVMQQLAEHGLTPEEWGGQTLYASISAKTGKGVDELLEKILLQADVLDLKTTHQGPARGVVIESRLDKTQGPVCTVLVQQGRLETGNVVSCGVASGRLRAMMDGQGQRLREAGPATAVEIVGLDEVPTPGDRFVVLDDERKAGELAAARRERIKALEAQKVVVRPSVQELLIQARDGKQKEVNVVLKTDVQGSLEAIRQALVKLDETVAVGKVKLQVIRSAVGAISLSDVMLASASKGIVLGFNVRTDPQAYAVAEKEGVQVQTYEIIYELLEKMKALMLAQVEPTYRHEVIGHAEVRQLFRVSTVGIIAGCYVKDGKVLRSALARVLRATSVVHDGKVGSLKRFKDDVREVPAGMECGIGLANYADVQAGDTLEFYTKEEVPAV